MRKIILIALFTSAPLTYAQVSCAADDVTTVVANKPVVAEAAAPKIVPLHEHPILVRMLNRNNELRSRVGLRPHRISPKLTKAAQDHANYMAATGSMDHYSNAGPQGRANRWGFAGSGVLENIAAGQSDVNSVFGTWQGSGAHWSNMCSNTTDAGFGYQTTSNGAKFWCAVYGTERGETVIVTEKGETAVATGEGS